MCECVSLFQEYFLRKPALNARKCLDHEMGGGVRVITEVLVKGTGIVSLYAGVKDHMRQSLSPSPCFGRSHQQRSDAGPAEISVDNEGTEQPPDTALPEQAVHKHE